MNMTRIERRLTPHRILYIGIILTLIIFFLGYYISWREYHKQFVADASKRAEDVVEMLQDRLQEVDGLARFIEGMGRRGEVDRNSFRDFVRPIIAHAGVQALAWAPAVPASRRAGIERAGGFRLTRRSPDNLLIPVTTRQLYYPLSLLEPAARNGRLLGYDLGSEPELEEALGGAERSGGIRVTTGAMLVRGLWGNSGFILCAPVLDAAHKLYGFTLGIFGVEELLEAALRPTARMALNTTLMDLGVPAGGAPLHRYEVPRGISGQLPGLDDLLFPQLTYHREFSFAGRQWRIECEGTRGYHAETVSLAFLLILPLGLLITRLSYLYLREQLRSREEVEALVKTRTAELAASNSRLQTILDNLPMAAWLKDREGRLLMVNNRYASGVGRPRSEILGLTDFELWPPDQAEAYHAVDEDILSSGMSRQVDEHRVDGEDGVEWFEMYTSPIIALDGAVLGTTGIAWDVTLRKQSEEQIMMQQRKLENLNLHLAELVQEEIAKNRAKDLLIMSQEKLASVGQLAAGVAHEINTPLAFVTSNLRVFLDYFQRLRGFHTLQQELLAATAPVGQLRDLAATEQRLDVPFILEDAPELIAESLMGVERVSRIVLDLKSFSRVDASSSAAVDLSVCLESALTILAHEMKDAATIQRGYKPLPAILCNPGEMNQLFLHLLRNAVQSLASPGLIILGSRHDDAYVYVMVTDNGHGIPEEFREQIFEPFFTTRRVGEGAGLGLSVCRDIVAKHHGQLRVESAVGAGTVVTVRLPREGKKSPGHEEDNLWGSGDAVPDPLPSLSHQGHHVSVGTTSSGWVFVTG